jgi:nitroreductase
MDAMENILTRRSVRKFTSEKITPDEVTQLLRAAMQAPSANNGQPWHFIVVDKRELLDEIPKFHPHAKMLFEAHLAIIVCAFVPKDKLYGLWVQDCSAATLNILLAAHSMGLGGVWMGVHPREDRVNGIIAMFDLPEEIKPFSIIALGHPAEIPPQVDRFSLEKVHFNSW